MNPIEKFTIWQKEELEESKVSIPKACCLSTIGLDGFPNARFVELKEVIDGHFVVAGPLSSRKGMEIKASDKVAITCWWTATEKQVRIQGKAVEMTDKQADVYFNKRGLGSKIVYNISKQGQEINDVNTLISTIEEMKLTAKEEDIKRPDNWGAYAIVPVRIEFFEFTSMRFQHRTLYEMQDGIWSKKYIQP